MPIYEYHCKQCGASQLERMLSVSHSLKRGGRSVVAERNDAPHRLAPQTPAAGANKIF